MKQEKLKQLRSQIDTLNKEIVGVLSQRAKLSQQIGEAKGKSRIYDPARETAVLNQVRALNNGPLSDDALAAIFKEIIAACRNLQAQLTAAYLGPEGTYSEEAARAHLGTTTTLKPYASLGEVLAAAEKGETDVAVLPAENSTEGPVGRTLDLLLNTPLSICGEILLPIHHQLLSSNQALGQIREVAAHPQALAQCRQWLAAHLPHAKQVPAASNGEAAKSASQKPARAAIAGKGAAGLYGLNTLASDIEDQPGNTTRFIVLGNAKAGPTGADKTSLVCAAPNSPGALLRLLKCFADEGVNLTKLESRPAAGTAWEYAFYIDIAGHEQDTKVAEALRTLKQYAAFVKVLGSYPRVV